MSQLANVIVGLERLSPTELETVSILVAARLDKARPPTPVSPESTHPVAVVVKIREDPDPDGPGSRVTLRRVDHVAALTESVQRLRASEESPACELSIDQGHPDAVAFMQAAAACAKDEPSGPGRKSAILQRYRAVGSAWKKLPQQIRSRFE